MSAQPGNPNQLLAPLKENGALPDLTGELIKLGIYEQYSGVRKSFKTWRRGEATSAKDRGSVTNMDELMRASSTVSGVSKMMFWYPDELSVQFRETVSYWIAASFMEGALLFFAAGFYGVFGGETWPSLTTALSLRPSCIGNIFFTLGTYFMYFEVINMGIQKGERVNFLWCDFRELREEYQVKWSSIIGGAAYFVGSLSFQWGCTAPLIGDWIPVQLAMILGGSLFVVGGVCEVVHNRVFVTPPTRLVWWVSVCNFSGDVCFLLSALPCTPEYYINVFVAVGAVLFLAGSLFAMGMWRAGMFGLTLLSQLNSAARSRGVPLAQRMEDGAVGLPVSQANLAQRTHMSARGIGFLLVFAACGALSIVNVCLGMKLDLTLHEWNILSQAVVKVVIVHMMLILQAAGMHSIPKEQPYRFLALASRIVSFVMLINGITTTIEYLQAAQA